MQLVQFPGTAGRPDEGFLHSATVYLYQGVFSHSGELVPVASGAHTDVDSVSAGWLVYLHLAQTDSCSFGINYIVVPACYESCHQEHSDV